MKAAGIEAESRFQFSTTRLSLQDGTRVAIRKITPTDEPLMILFHRSLSDLSVHFRYFGVLSFGSRTGHKRLAAICSPDQNREIALIADYERENRQHEIVAVGRLIKVSDVDDAEFAIVLSDFWQGNGLGTQLLGLLVKIGRKAGLRRIVGHVLAENEAMLHVSRSVGFALHFHAAADEWEAVMNLNTLTAMPPVR